MALHAFIPGGSSKLWGLVFDDSRDILNVFFKDEYGLGGLKSDLGTDVPDVNIPSDVSAHMAYHGLLADELESVGGDTDLVKMARDADPKHGHMQLPTGSNARDDAGGALMLKKWIDKNTARTLLPML